MSKDLVRLSVPAKPDYILAVRLLVSAVSERAGFTMDDIEDMKVASAEACMLLLIERPKFIEIEIAVEEEMRVRFIAVSPDGRLEQADEVSELSKYLLEALVDKCEFINEDGILKGVNIYKK